MRDAKREPFIHISKRGELRWYQAWGVRAAAILLALVTCGLICLAMTGEDPFQIYGAMFTGSFGKARKTWVTMQDVAMLLCVSLAVTPAFRMRFWNIGGEGQTLIGCLASAACMILLRDVLPELGGNRLHAAGQRGGRSTVGRDSRHFQGKMEHQ